MLNNGRCWSRCWNDWNVLSWPDGQARDALNEEQYRELCEACDRVLLAPDSTIERLAIPWLHVIREHPVFLNNYVDLFEPAKGVKSIARQWWRVLRNKAGWLWQLGRASRADGQLWFAPKELPGRIDVLIVSHLLSASHAGQADDFYFSELPNKLVVQGYSVVIALINHSDQPGAALADKWKESTVPRVVLSASLGILEEVALYRRLKNESFRLRKLEKKETAGLSRKVLVQASQEALSGGSRRTLRMAQQIGALVAKLKPKAIAVTYEGHAWERVAFAAARSTVPEVRCIGYQHSSLFRLQHAIRRNLARGYNPDQILTAGTIGKEKLEQSPGLKGIPISVLGSNRGVKAHAYGVRPNLRLQILGHSDSRACLVLPEGIDSECHLLFEFSLECAQACPDIQFIWRLHPNVTFESLTIQNTKLRNLPYNVVLSREDLEVDIARCCWALYRGTTAIIQVAGAGIRPIYLQVPGEMSVDPLYELGVWRTSVAKTDDLKRVIEADKTNPLLDGESAFIFAEQYLGNFFTPLNTDVFKAAI